MIKAPTLEAGLLVERQLNTGALCVLGPAQTFKPLY